MGYYGIDLGTTNSCLARYDEQRKCAVVIPNNGEGIQTIASVVAFDPLTPSVASVGNCAKDIIENTPERGIKLVKRSMGSDDVVLSLEDGAEFRPQDISAFILKQIKAYGEEATNEEVKDVVVTVPAYFGMSECEATREAVEAAGMQLCGLISEPVAATLGYFENYFSPSPLTVLVYDLGGATFDVSVVRAYFGYTDRQRVELLIFDGNHRLGGMDWDNELYNLVIEKVEAVLREEDPDFDLSDDDMNVIRNKIENLKKRLSNTSIAPFRGYINGERVNVQVSREEFESRTAHLLEQTKTLCNGVLAHPKMAGVKVDRVLLVGGSTLMPMVQSMVKSIFPETEIFVADPHHVVAKGACIAHYVNYPSVEEKITKKDFEYIENLKIVRDFLRTLELPLTSVPAEAEILEILMSRRNAIRKKMDQGQMASQMDRILLGNIEVIEAAISNSEIRELAFEIVLEEKLAIVRRGIDIMSQAGINTYTRIDIEAQAMRIGVSPEMVERVYREKEFHKVNEVTPFEKYSKRYSREKIIKDHLHCLWLLKPDTKKTVYDLYSFMEYYHKLSNETTHSPFDGLKCSFDSSTTKEPIDESGVEIEELRGEFDRDICRSQVEEWIRDCAINRPRNELTEALVNLLYECMLMLKTRTIQEDYRVSLLYENCNAFEQIDCVADSARVDQRFADAKIKEIAAHFNVDEKVAITIYNDRIQPLIYIPQMH